MLWQPWLVVWVLQRLWFCTPIVIPLSLLFISAKPNQQWWAYLKTNLGLKSHVCTSEDWNLSRQMSNLESRSRISNLQGPNSNQISYPNNNKRVNVNVNVVYALKQKVLRSPSICSDFWLVAVSKLDFTKLLFMPIICLFYMNTAAVWQQFNNYRLLQRNKGFSNTIDKKICTVLLRWNWERLGWSKFMHHETGHNFFQIVSLESNSKRFWIKSVSNYTLPESCI